MKPAPYIHLFAVLSITALCLQIVSDFWMPMVIGAAAVTAIAVFLRH